MILLDKIFCRSFFFFRKSFSTLLFSNLNITQFPIHHDEVKDTLFPSMNYMYMNGFMLIRVEIEDKTEVFKYLWHKTNVF